MKQHFKLYLLGMFLLGGGMTGTAGLSPLGGTYLNNLLSQQDLQQLIQKVEMDVKSKQSIKGYRYDGSLQDYQQRPGIVRNAEGNCDNAYGYYSPSWLFNNDVNNASQNYYTERNGRIPDEMKGQHHWVTFDFNNPLDEFILKYTCVINVDQVPYGEAPTKIALVAPKAGETTVWTDTLYIGKSIPTYPTEYSKGVVKDNSTYVGRIKLSKPAKRLRFVGLERSNNPATALEADGPFWGLSEMRVYNTAEWDAETVHYSQVPQALKDGVTQSVAAAKKALENDGDLAKAYEQLETAYNAFSASFKEIAETEAALQELVVKAEEDYKSKQNAFGHAYEGSVADYQKFRGLVGDGVGNCNNANGYYKTAWMFNSDVANTSENYYTERNGRIPQAMRGQRHWVMFDLPQEYDDLCIKFTCVINVDQVAYGEAPTKIALVAPKAGEENALAWTDTLYIGKTIPTYPTIYQKGVIKENSTFVGRFQLPHPVKKFRFVGLERLNNPVTTQEKDGPFWGLAEMRIFDGKEWEDSPIFQRISSEIKGNLLNCIMEGKNALENDKDKVMPAYKNLKKAYNDFYKAYLQAKSCIVTMNTAQTVDQPLTFYVNHSTSAYYVDWGDGNLVKYETDEKNPFNEISGKVKGSQVQVSCENGWEMFRAENNKLTAIDLSHAESLCQLYLRGNQLKQISLKSMAKLRDLDCSDNQIEKIDVTNADNISEDLPNIVQLNLKNNKLKGEYNLQKLANLTYLNVANNNLTKVNLGESKVRTLICSHNQFSKLLSLNDMPRLMNVVANGNACTGIIFANKCKEIVKCIIDDNKLSSILDVSQAAKLNYFSCSNNNMRFLQLPSDHALNSFQVSNNRFRFSVLPSESIRPKNLSFDPQDTIDITGVKGIVKTDTLTYAPVATSWADREKSYIDIAAYCYLSDKTLDVDVKWYSVLDDGSVKQLIPCHAGADGDFCFEEGKVSFFTPHKKAYAVITSNIYNCQLVTYPIRIGADQQTGIEKNETAESLKIAKTENGMLLTSSEAIFVNVVGMNGMSVWRGIVDGQQFVKLGKGGYLVNQTKVIL